MLREKKNGTHTLEIVWQFLTKLKLLLPYDPAVMCVPWHLSKVVENVCPHKNLHTDVYRSLFIIAKIVKEPRCPLVDEWINKRWYIQTVEYYSGLKRNELSSHEKIWKKLKCILLSERSKTIR